MKGLRLIFIFLGACLAGCCSDRVVTVRDKGLSSDHRIFRIASLTKLMMEPVLWKLEDSKVVDFDRPVTDYFKDPLPPEFGKVTLRDLHDNKSGLPREFIDPWCLGDVYSAFKCGFVGSDIYEDFDTRREFVRKLWTVRVRSALRHDGPRYSNMGYALMMMAICDATGRSIQELCEEELVRPLGLKDTTFEPNAEQRARLTPSCAGHLPWFRFEGQIVPDHRDGEVTRAAGGMLSSAADMLKVAEVIYPQLDRAKGLLEAKTLPSGHRILYRCGMIYGGNAFLGFDLDARRAAVLLKNVTCWWSNDGFEYMESLASEREM